MTKPILLEKSGASFAAGVRRFRDRARLDSVTTSPRIYVEVFPETWPIPVLAMVDTGAPWCIFEPEIASKIRDHLEVIQEDALLHSRLGLFRGVLGHGHLKIVAEEGEDLNVQVLMFLSPDWHGGNFIGYQGFLDRIRFAVDPHRNRFYFASL